MKKVASSILYSSEVITYLLFILVYPFLFIRYGLDYSDSGFHYMAYQGTRLASNFTFFDAILGNIWRQFMGDTVMSYRILAAFLNMLSIVVPFLLLKGINNCWREKLRYMAVGVVFATSISFNMLSWEVFAAFALSLIFVTGLNYIKHPDWILLFFLSILSAFIIAIRFPSVVVAIPILGVIFVKEYQISGKLSRSIIKSLAYLVMFGFFYVLLWYFFYYNSQTSLGHSGVAVIDSSPNRNLFQSLMRIYSVIPKYISHGFDIVGMMSIVAIIVVVWKKMITTTKRNLVKFAVPILLIIAYFRFKILFISYNLNLSLFYSSFLLLITAFLIHKAIQERKTDLILLFSFSAMIGFASAFGSDTGLLKLAHSYTFVLPVVMIAIQNKIEHKDKIGFYLLVLIVTLFSITNTILGKTYDDRRIFRLHSTINNERLKGVQTNEIRKQHIEAILASVKKIDQKSNGQASFVFYGSGSHLFSFITGTKQPYNLPYSMDYNDSRQADNLGKYLASTPSKPYVVLIYGYPESREYMGNNAITDRLDLQSYRIVDEGNNYQIYGDSRFLVTN